MLQRIVKIAKPAGIEVYIDGGIRTGTDVLKAIALGAQAVFVGRPVLWGLALKVGTPSFSTYKTYDKIVYVYILKCVFIFKTMYSNSILTSRTMVRISKYNSIGRYERETCMNTHKTF